MQKNIAFLDGVRGFAILMVVSAHTHVDDYITPISGGLGVDMFFVLSSFLVTSLFYEKLSVAIGSASSIGLEFLAYGCNRFMRIYPLMTFTAILTYFVPYLQQSFCNIEPVQALQPLYLSESPCHFWTISVEIQYYVVIPILSIEAILFGDYWWVLITSILGFSIIHDTYAVRGSNTNLANHLTTFLTGSCLGITYINWKKRFKPLSRAKAKSLDVAAYIMVFLILGLALQRWYYPFLFKPRNPVHYTNISFMMALLIVKELLQPSILSRFFESSLLTYCGKISFSVYLYHLSAIRYAREQESGLSFYYFSFIYALAQGSIIHYLFERPIMKFSKYLNQRIRDNWNSKCNGYQLAIESASQKER
jgi:peptidoglycan/LPS O-acetylase OafA/YrhL